MPWGWRDRNPNSSYTQGGRIVDRGGGGCGVDTTSSIMFANKFNFLIQAEISTVATLAHRHAHTHTHNLREKCGKTNCGKAGAEHLPKGH